MRLQPLINIINKHPIFILIFIIFLVFGIITGNWFCQEIQKEKIQQLENQIVELNQEIQKIKTQKDLCVQRERELETNLSSCYEKLINCSQIANQLHKCQEKKNLLQDKYDDCTNELNRLKEELNYRITLSGLFKNYTYYSLPFWLFF